MLAPNRLINTEILPSVTPQLGSARFFPIDVVLEDVSGTHMALRQHNDQSSAGSKLETPLLVRSFSIQVSDLGITMLSVVVAEFSNEASLFHVISHVIKKVILRASNTHTYSLFYWPRT